MATQVPPPQGDLLMLWPFSDILNFAICMSATTLAIVPAFCLTAALPIVWFACRRREEVVLPSPLLSIKTIVAGTLACAETSATFSWRTLAAHELDSATSTVMCLGALSLLAMTIYNHRFTLGSDGLLAAWYVMSIMCDCFRLWLLQSRPDFSEVIVLTTFALLLKIFLVFLDELPKAGWIQDENLRVHVNPSLTAGFWSRAFLISFSHSMLLNVPDNANSEKPQHLLPEQSSERLSQKFNLYWSKSNKSSRFSLVSTLCRTHLGLILQTVVPHLLHSLLFIAQPVLIQQLLLYIEKPSEFQNFELYFMAAAITVYAGILIMNTICTYNNALIAIAFRGSLATVIHTKTYTLPYLIAEKATATVFIQRDVDEVVSLVDISTRYLCSLVEIAISCFWLVEIAGTVSISFIILVIMYILASYFNRARKLAYQDTLENASGHRIARTSKFISQIKAIRITGLNEVVWKNIDTLCRGELRAFIDFRYWAMVSVSTLTTMCSANGPLLFGGIIYGTSSLKILSPTQAFPCLAIIAIFQEANMTILGAIDGSRMNAALNSAMQIQEFLCLPENDTVTGLLSTSEQPPNAAKADQPPNDVVIRLKSVSLGIQGRTEPILRKVELEIKRYELVMVTGVTGSGKSTFLRSLINDSVLMAGDLIKEPGRIGYCDQKLWLRHSSLRDNIIGSLQFDQTWYNEVLHACLLRKDISRLANGDQTLIGSNGMNLSGAQGYRVALARALYLRAPYLVLDNTFAGLDYGTYCEIFKRLFGKDGILKKSPATVVMTTHSTTFLEDADRVLFMHPNGRVSMHTDIHSARFRQCWKTLGLLENTIGETANPTEAEDEKTNISGILSNGSNTPLSSEYTGPSLYELYLAHIPSGLLLLALFSSFMMTFLYVVPSIYIRFWLELYPDTSTPFVGYLLISLASVISSIYSMMIWDSIATPVAVIHVHETLLDSIMTSKMSFLTRVSHSDLLHLFSSDINSILQVLPFQACRFVYGIIVIVIYAIILSTMNRYCLVLLPIIFCSLGFVRSVYSRSIWKIRQMDTGARAQLSRHHDESTLGLRYIRASGCQEASAQRGLSLLDSSQISYNDVICTGRWLTLAVNATIMLVQLVIVASAIFGKHPVTSAALGASMRLAIRLDELEWMVKDFADTQTSLAALDRIQRFVKTAPQEEPIEERGTETETAGTTKGPQDAVVVPNDRKSKRQAAVQGSGTNTEEVERRNGLPKGENGRKQPLPADWPREGCVVFTDVTAKYDSKDTAPPAIREVSITVPAGQKVGIIGRTGSGKTSLLMTLLNFLEYSGTITVDGYDISEIPYLALRQRITTISQDVIDLGGTVQYNLCPWTTGVTGTEEGNTILDSLKIVLESLNMWEIIEKGGGITAVVADLELSHGQMQLLTIARGMLHNLKTGSNVVIMDELTSHLDPRNEKIVKAALDKAFSDRTVISVVHREGLLKGADIVLRMEDGKIVETKHLTSNKTAAASSATVVRNKTAQASSSRRAEPPRPQVAQGPPRVIAPALQAMMDYMNNPNAPEPLDPNRHAIAELRMNFERRRMGLPPTTLPRQADDPSRPFSWSEQSDQPVQPPQTERSQQNIQASRLGPSQRSDRAQQARQSRRPQ